MKSFESYRANVAWDENSRDTEDMINERRFAMYKKYVDKIEEDKLNEVRVEQNICTYCYYKIESALMSVTETNCGRCEKTMYFTSTKTDRLCMSCADKTESCKECGGSMN